MTEKESKKILLEQLYKPFKDISKTPLSGNGATRVVFGFGNPAAEILILGEAPGRQEDLEGKPFIGRSGKLLRTTLEESGLKLEEIFITNTVKCRPPNNRTPLAKEIEFYKKLFLEKELQIIQPKVIIAVGSIALSALFGKIGKISELRGLPLHYKNIIVIPTYHPAYILRKPAALNDFQQDIQTAASQINQKNNNK